MTRRDYQRSKVYAAEDHFGDLLDRSVENAQIMLAGSTLVLEPEAKFSTPVTVQAYVDRVLSHPAVVARFGPSRVTVRQRKGVTKTVYAYRLREIAVPDTKSALREIVILHELAHHFAGGLAGHGPQFTAAFLELVGAVMGVQAQLALRIVYGDGGVEVS
jgi:putative metallohydrolase (TIGR04338 family)